MAKSTTRRVKLGEPEHVVSGERARQLLTNQLRFKPEAENPLSITTEFIPRMDILDEHATTIGREINDIHVYNEYEISGNDTEAIATAMADKVITALEGNTNQFNKFTVESLAVMSTDMMDQLLRTHEITQADDIDTAINMLPASNGKTFTAVQMLRVEEYMLDGQQFHDACEYASDAAVYPKTWIKPVDGKDVPLVNPRGKADIETYVALADSPFNEITESQQDAVVAIYEGSGKSLDELLEKHGLERVDNTPDLGSGLDDLSDAALSKGSELPF